MIAAGLQLVWAAGLWTALQAAVTASDDTRVSTHSRLVGSGSDEDVQQAPRVGLGFSEGKNLSLALGYSPQLTLVNVTREEERATSVMHTGTLNFTYADRQMRFNLSENGSFGTQSFTTLQQVAVDPNAPVNPTAPRIQLVPALQTARTESLNSRASFDYNWDHQTRSGLTASYDITGGRDPSTQAALPLVKILGAFANTGFTLSRDDGLTFTLGMTRIDSSGVSQRDYTTLSATTTWSHTFQRGVTGQLTLGGYGDKSVSPGYRPRYTLSGTGGASTAVELVRRRGMLVSIAAGGSVVPAINQLTGTLERRLQGTAAFIAQLEEFTFNLGADGAETIPHSDPQAVTLIGASAGLRYNPSQYLAFGADFREAWQTSHEAQLARGKQWSATLSIILRAPTTKF